MPSKELNWPTKSLWRYAENEGLVSKLEAPLSGDGRRPPVFLKPHADLNILFPPRADARTRVNIIRQLPTNARHRWFRSMKSSQALAQSVFANLLYSDDLDALNELGTDQGWPAFGLDLGAVWTQLEYKVDYLGEPQQTSIDMFVDGKRRIAIEGKFSEQRFGECSRPKLRQGKDPNFETDYCDGRFAVQRGRRTRCALSELQIRYWRYIPDLFPAWQSDRDHACCPLRFSYQIVRNILAACVLPNGKLESGNAHALIIYDERNPEMHRDGVCRRQIDLISAALKDRTLLRTCSWQSVVMQLDRTGRTQWLVEALRAKYAF